MAGSMNVPGEPALEGIGATTKTPSCLEGRCWDTCGCTGNGRGGRGEFKDRRTQDFKNFRDGVQDLLGGHSILLGRPPPLIFKYCQQHSLGGET